MTNLNSEFSSTVSGFHRKRVTAALDHKSSDRVPLTLGSPSCSIHHVAHQRLLSFLNFPFQDDAVITDNILQIVETDNRLIDYFDIDLQWLLPEPEEVSWDQNEHIFTDPFGRSFELAGGFFNQNVYPLFDCSFNELSKYKFPELDSARFRKLGIKARNLFDQGYGIGIDGPWGLYEISASLFGTPEFLMGLILNPELITAIAERVLNEHLFPFYDLLLADTADLVQIVGISDDLGSQSGLLFSPKIYRQIFKPLHKQLIEHIRSKTSAKIYMHSDGSIYPIIPDLIEIGVDGLNPIQYTAKDMNLDLLTREFGRDLGFFGGVVENEVLSYSSPAEIYNLVKQNTAILKKQNAFIFAPIHNISQEVPPENIIALYQAGLKYGQN